jgi:hypothetical protein
MDTALSLLISAGIIAFGIWSVAGAHSSWWSLIGVLPIVIGSISSYQACRFGWGPVETEHPESQHRRPF